MIYWTFLRMEKVKTKLVSTSLVFTFSIKISIFFNCFEKFATDMMNKFNELNAPKNTLKLTAKDKIIPRKN